MDPPINPPTSSVLSSPAVSVSCGDYTAPRDINEVLRSSFFFLGVGIGLLLCLDMAPHAIFNATCMRKRIRLRNSILRTSRYIYKSAKNIFFNNFARFIDNMKLIDIKQKKYLKFKCIDKFQFLSFDMIFKFVSCWCLHIGACLFYVFLRHNFVDAIYVIVNHVSIIKIIYYRVNYSVISLS